MSGNPPFQRTLNWAMRVVFVVSLGSQLSAQSQFEAFLPPKDSLARPKLLVLKTGQVLQGEIEGRIGGYTVHGPAGSVIVQYEDVRAAALSLEDAYQRMAANTRNPTANDRIELAQWCLHVGLIEQARDELLSALVLEPNRIEARRLLIQIESRQPPTVQAGHGLDLTAPAARPTANPLPTAGQLSRDRVAEFSRQIQPLLLNTCGNGACHGGNKAGDFHLRPSARISRLDTDANLEMILRFIDAAQPENSPLLITPKQPDGVHDSAFRGPKGPDQFERLANWASLIAREAGPNRAGATPPAATAGTILPAAAFVPAAELLQSRGLPEAGPANATPSPPLDADINDAFLRQILENNRPDPFDPEEFNRRVHGTASGRSSAGSR